MKNYDRVIVDTTGVRIYDFSNVGESDADALARVKLQKTASVASWEEICKKYPSEQNSKYLETVKATEYRVMSYDEFEAFQKEQLLKRDPVEITEGEYNEMLDVLPPLAYVTRNGVTEFCMSEFYTGPFTTQYAHDKRTGKYYSKLVDYSDKSTWLDKILTEQK